MNTLNTTSFSISGIQVLITEKLRALLSGHSTQRIGLYVTGGLLTFIYIARQFSIRRKGALPPGPRGVPLLGNVYDMPAGHEWLTYDKWRREYGRQRVLIRCRLREAKCSVY